MKGWIVEIGFRFYMESEDDQISNKEIKKCLVRRLTAGGIQAHVFNVRKGRTRRVSFIDLGGLEG